MSPRGVLLADRPFLRRFLLLLFAISGFSSLVYEILWTKYFALLFGGDILAVSVVVAAFMAGLAIGSYLLGRVADRSRNLLLLYGMLEVGILLCAVAMPLGLTFIRTVFIDFLQGRPFEPLWVDSLEMLTAFLLLIVPTVFMGGTLPVMVRIFAGDHIGRDVARLYAINTLGAACGCIFAGFILLPNLGLAGTGWVAAVGNLLAATGAIVLAFLVLQPALCKEEILFSTSCAGAIVPPSPRFFLLSCIALLGALSLACEILWTRVFILSVGNTIYAFSLILCTYLIGLCLGGWIHSQWLFRRNKFSLFFYLCCSLGLLLLVTTSFYDQLAYLFYWEHQFVGENWWLHNAFRFLILSGVILPPAALFGALLPVAVDLVSPRRPQFGQGVGLIFFVNTAGAILGSLVTSLALIPALGLQGSFRLVAGVILLLAIVYSFRQHFGIRFSSVLALSFLVLLLALLPIRWDQKLMNLGVYYYSPVLAGIPLKQVDADKELLHLVEGRELTAAVFEERTGQRLLRINGKTDGSSGGDLSTQLLLGYLPMMAHPAPDRALIIGLGTGVTLKGVSDFPVKDVECVEISPEVAQLSEYFQKQNNSVLRNAKVKFRIADARLFLAINPGSYDVIISEPSNPWQTGNANLFTLEFYNSVIRRLNPGGIFCQWMPLYDLPPEKLKIALATLLKAFPHVQVFRIGGDLVLLGSSSPITFHYDKMAEQFKLAAVGDALKQVGIDRIEDVFANYYIADDGMLRTLVAGSALNTDNRSSLEYTRQMGFNTEQSNLRLLSGIVGKKPLVPDTLKNLGTTRDLAASRVKFLSERFSLAGRLREAVYLSSVARKIASGEMAVP